MLVSSVVIATSEVRTAGHCLQILGIASANKSRRNVSILCVGTSVCMDAFGSSQLGSHAASSAVQSLQYN